MQYDYGIHICNITMQFEYAVNYALQLWNTTMKYNYGI